MALLPMASKGTPQFITQVFPQQANVAAAEAELHFGRQDKARISSARTATGQPAPQHTPLRAAVAHRNSSNKKEGRSQTAD